MIYIKIHTCFELHFACCFFQTLILSSREQQDLVPIPLEKCLSFLMYTTVKVRRQIMKIYSLLSVLLNLLWTKLNRKSKQAEKSYFFSFSLYYFSHQIISK